MNWKIILSLAVFASPIAYCTLEEGKDIRATNAALAKTCIEAHRVWVASWGGYCYT
jgi:hypothetical protein